MQISTLSGIAAIALYFVSTLLQGQRLRARQQSNSPMQATFLIGLLAVIAHGISASGVIYNADGYHFGIVQISTLIFAAICLIVLASSIRKPFGALVVGLFPLAILSIATSLLVETNYPPQNIGGGIAVHVLLSILAYSIFTIAALQACLLAFQNYQLKHKHAASVIKRFPPLQDMETFLFELLWIGQALLTLGIIGGVIFVQDLSENGLAHKTFFSVVAWIVFAVLLWGRHKLGWRGKTAIRFTLSGFALLILGFYGSKFALEYILS
ncbi:MAG: cytochrome c biogenesis protein CcsA [Pseudohongiellaceae bacterium]|nr:cytochrome c biogenesis protein CcsA [Pseudohongiellaceae bacterium]